MSIVKFEVTFFYYFSLIVNVINVMVTFTLKTFHGTHTASLQRKNSPSDRESEADDYLQVGYFFLLQELRLMEWMWLEEHRARWSQVGISSFSCKWMFNVGSQNVQQFPESLTVVLNRSQHQKKIHGRHKIPEEYLLVCPAIICLFTHKHLPGPSYVLSIIPRLWERHSVCLPIVKKHRQANLESLLLSPITKPKLNN